MKKTLTYSTVFLLMLFAACSRKSKENHSMTELYTRNGVPVETVVVAEQPFSTFVTYYAEIKGIEESIAGAPMDEKIETVTVKAGDMVRKGQVLITLPSDSPASQYRQAEIAYESSKTALDRIEGLFRAGGISQQERDNAQTRHDVALANWQALRKTIKVEAPISGMVTRVFVAPSDNVKAKAPLVSIAMVQRLKAEIWVSESDVSQLKPGSKATVEWLGQRCLGHISQMDLAMNRQQHGFRTVVEFENAEGLFRPGVTARILLETYSNPHAIVVKRKHVFSENQKNFVYLEKQGRAQKQPVHLDRARGMDVEVHDGLQVGDRLITTGLSLLRDGAKIKLMAK